MANNYNGDNPEKDGFICDGCDKEYDLSIMDITSYYRMAGHIFCVECYADNGRGLRQLALSLTESYT